MSNEFKIQEIANSPQGLEQSVLLSRYTGIEPSQLGQLSLPQAQKVLYGLFKQLDLATALHGDKAKNELHSCLGTYFSGVTDIDSTAQQINSLLVFGDIRPTNGSGIEHLHDRIAHFWRILGWEELGQIGANDGSVKISTGSIEEITRSSGNLIRTLDLLAERWTENKVGPHLIYPVERQSVVRDNTNGYSYAQMKGPHSNTHVIVTGAGEFISSTEHKKFYAEQSNLMRRLLDRYPMELAFAIYDYYAFTQGLDQKELNVAVMQEYVQKGQKRIKGMMSGGYAVLTGGRADEGFHQKLIAYSSNGYVSGSPTNSQFAMFDIPVHDDSLVTLVHGRTAHALIASPQDAADYLSVNPQHGDLKRQIVTYAKAKDKFRKGVPASKQEKPIISVAPMGNIAEYSAVDLTEDMLGGIAKQVGDFAVQTGINLINLEAAHIHADTTPTGRQVKGMKIGSYLAQALEQIGIKVRRTSMIDEDHVPNALDHSGYIKLMSEQHFDIDEVIYESSPAIREIAVSAIVTLQQLFPERIHLVGNAMLFDIPNSDLQVELIKDVTQPIVELGCVIFDVGLTLAKIYPELAEAYMPGGSAAVHAQMFDIYNQSSDPKERQKTVKAAFPEKTRTYEDVIQAQQLPQIIGKNAAIINVLEGFYSAQQIKLENVLKSLNIPIRLINISFSDQGLQLNMPQVDDRKVSYEK